jgi:hypothetical protein
MSFMHFKHAKSNRMRQVWFATTLEFNWEFLHVCEICLELRKLSLRECSTDILTCCSCLLESFVGHCVLPGCWQTDTTGTIPRQTCSFFVLIKNTVVSFT